jgi:hypothetical protein
VDETEQCAMRLALSHTVQIEPRLDFVFATLQALGVGTIDARKAIELNRM